MEERSLKPTPGLLSVVRRLREAGHEAWAVGGAVRDRLLGEIAGDWDVATDALPGRVQELFPRTHPVGMEHGTVGVRETHETIEVTTFRADVATDGRPADVRFGVSLDQDLARRDFTINAIAWDPLSGELRDPFGGQRDFERRILRAVGEPDRRFPEDDLRVLRAFRFAARFDLAYDEATRVALGRHAAGLPRLSGERVRDELTKTLSQCRLVSRALADWQETGAMARLLPEVAVCFGVEQNRFHADDVGTHTLMVVDRVHPRQPFLRLVALLHDIGKPPTRERNPATGDWTFPLHDRVGAELARQIVQRLRFSTREAERAVHLVRVHMDMFPHEASDAAVRRWVRRVGEENVWDLYRLHMADWLGNRNRGHERPLRDYFGRVRAVLAAGSALAVEDLAIGGEDLIALGLTPGPLFGEILATALERVVEDPSLNTREALLSLVRDELLPAQTGGASR